MQTCPTATNVATIFSLPCVKGGGTACRDGGIVFSLIFHENNPSVSSADSSPYTGEPPAAAGLLNGKSLSGTTRLAGGFREPIKKDRDAVSVLVFISSQTQFLRLLHLLPLCRLRQIYLQAGRWKAYPRPVA